MSSSRSVAVVFDLDGTLVHSAPDIAAAANVALAVMGRDALDLETVTSFVGNGVEKLMERCLFETGVCDPELQERAIQTFLSAYAENPATLTRPFEGVAQALARLDAAGVVMGVCTNKPQGPAQDICAALGMSGHLRVIAGAVPDVPKKPDPTPLLRTIVEMQVEPQNTVFVGDSGIDFQTARAAGVAFRLYSGGYLNTDLPDLGALYRFDYWSMITPDWVRAAVA
ncbi:MAG: phosphoglycolate phosphatase [Pseudomonadota bacterium]